MALAIVSALISPLIASANPLEMMEGWVYTSFGFSENQGLPEGVFQTISSSSIDDNLTITEHLYNDQVIVSFEELLMERQVTRDGVIVDEQFWEILDTAGPFSTGIQSVCQMNGQDDSGIFAIAKPPYIDVKWITDFQVVWRPNLVTKQLEQIPSDNIRCLNIHYGYDS